MQLIIWTRLCHLPLCQAIVCSHHIWRRYTIDWSHSSHRLFTGRVVFKGWNFTCSADTEYVKQSFELLQVSLYLLCVHVCKWALGIRDNVKSWWTILEGEKRTKITKLRLKLNNLNLNLWRLFFFLANATFNQGVKHRASGPKLAQWEVQSRPLVEFWKLKENTKTLHIFGYVLKNYISLNVKIYLINVYIFALNSLHVK